VSATNSPVDVLLVSSDLFLGSRVRGAAESQGRSLQVAGSGAMALERLQSATCLLVLVDLETPGLRIGELVAARAGHDRPTIIAYGPHVHEQRLDAARQAGCDRVLTRGQFDATLPQLLRNLLPASGE
jgi:CheY-like chemotaxis protein